MMSSKLQDIEKQFPSGDFERLPTLFQFEHSADPKVKIILSSTENCFATVETTREVINHASSVLVFGGNDEGTLLSASVRMRKRGIR